MEALFTRLEEASSAGDVNLLRELLKKDKLLLGRLIASASVRDNPLHIAAILGHAAFAEEVMRRKPELAKELNGQGLSPLHLAAALDHVAVVKELLKADFDLCLLREKHEGLLPLHVAVMKGRTLAVKVLVEACEEALHVHTNGGDTILHLAVKYNTFDTVEFLIDQVPDLNAKDNRGNTILHLAMTSKQLSVTKFLLNKAAIDVNAMNMKFSTPLDVLLESRQEHGDLVLGEMIRASGGKTAAEVLSDSEPALNASGSPTPTPTSGGPNVTPPHPRTSILQQTHCPDTRCDPEKATPKLQEEEKKKTMNHPDILLLVATLVATVTFQAALNPPGGFESEAVLAPDPNESIEKGHAVLEKSLREFLILDMFALFSSVSVILLFLCVVPRKRKIVIKFLVWIIWVAAFSMAMAFTVGISVIYDTVNSSKEMLLRGWLTVLMLGVTWALVRLLLFLLKKSGICNPLLLWFAKLKVKFSSLWKRFNNGAKSNWSNKCLWLLKCVRVLIFILPIICVLAGIALIWYLYAFTIVDL